MVNCPPVVSPNARNSEARLFNDPRVSTATAVFAALSGFNRASSQLTSFMYPLFALN